MISLNPLLFTCSTLSSSLGEKEKHLESTKKGKKEDDFEAQ
jgi:hypothetical protein